MAQSQPSKIEISSSIDELLASHANNGRHQSIPAGEQCCCGSQDCAYLKHNNAALGELEREVRTAASLGQALLARHEQYMFDAEAERNRMNDKISKLENEKKTLEFENARTTEENRELTDQLEELNTTVTESEAHVKSLEATLYSTQQEIKRLDSLAARAGQLDIRVAELELEQNVLQTRITTTLEDERSAIRRWKQAERELSHLEDQLETIEREAREEKERHAEILNRMERQRNVEKELDTAARRLKGAAAVTTLGSGKTGNNVVSHFVKDILQDNANLQLGIMELRELLTNSNDEVQHLREMLMEHQPMVDNGEESRSTTPRLQAELAAKESAVNQELHIHHHYHPPARPVLKKKRAILNSAYSTPPVTPKRRGRGFDKMEDPRTPRYSDSIRNSGFMSPAPPSAAAAILSQTSITIPSNSNSAHGDHRWSSQTVSDFAPSSAPTSPTGSMYRNSMLFDMNSRAGYYGDEESRPTSPGSSVDGMMSPGFNAYHRKRESGRSFTVPTGFMGDHTIQEEGDDDQDGDVDELKGLSAEQDINSASKQGDDTNISTPTLESDNFDINTETGHEDESPFDSSPDLEQPQGNPELLSFAQHRLRRTTSHESIISISGLDIHTLKSRPQQLEIGSPYKRTRPGGSSSIVPTPSLLSSSFKTTGPVVSASDATAVGLASDQYGLGFGPAKYGAAKRVTSTAYLRENFAAADRRTSTSSRDSAMGEGDHITGSRGLGQKVGGWISSRWGISPTPSHSSMASSSREGLRAHLDVADNLQAGSSQASINSLQSSTSGGSTKSPATPSMATLMGRPPGINQKGPIPGWSTKRREPIKFQVQPERVDLEGLSRALEE